MLLGHKVDGIPLARSAAFSASVSRELLILRRHWLSFVVRTVVQPTLFVFVFAFVFPRVGQGVGGVSGESEFASLLVPGSVGLATFIAGIQSVAVPLIGDLGFSRDIEDRAQAPIRRRVLAETKLVAGAIECGLAGLLVLPVAAAIGGGGTHVQPNWPAFAVALVVGAWCGAAFGLVLGVLIRPSQMALMYSGLVTPMTFLGASYYPWRALDSIPALQAAMLLNPLVYINEMMRYALTPDIPHMSFAVGVSVTLLWVVGLTFIAVRVLDARLNEVSG